MRIAVAEQHAHHYSAAVQHADGDPNSNQHTDQHAHHHSDANQYPDEYCGDTDEHAHQYGDGDEHAHEYGRSDQHAD